MAGRRLWLSETKRIMTGEGGGGAVQLVVEKMEWSTGMRKGGGREGGGRRCLGRRRWRGMRRPVLQPIMAENNGGSSGVLVVSAGEEEKRMEGKRGAAVGCGGDGGLR
ncbi:hypothetical protein HAX54_027278 [Datura stramonium]|uniref:Uncharacterized protein n=1 Tax=Datura stramonium TaxID=4076 RepID=A0ABS8V3F4_DATST|nr:hypothetical protein [Datura stramonium]